VRRPRDGIVFALHCAWFMIVIGPHFLLSLFGAEAWWEEVEYAVARGIERAFETRAERLARALLDGR
jgi:hypothetical protein